MEYEVQSPNLALFLGSSLAGPNVVKATPTAALESLQSLADDPEAIDRDRRQEGQHYQEDRNLLLSQYVRDYYNGGEEKEVFAGQEEFWSVVLIVSVCLCFVSVSALLPPSQCVVTGSESVI